MLILPLLFRLYFQALLANNNMEIGYGISVYHKQRVHID